MDNQSSEDQEFQRPEDKQPSQIKIHHQPTFGPKKRNSNEEQPDQLKTTQKIYSKDSDELEVDEEEIVAHNTTGDKDRKRRKAPQTVVLSSGNKMFQNTASANPPPNIVGKFCAEPPHEQEILSSSRIYGTP